jgi:linoleoyl-CoA desaturase
MPDTIASISRPAAAADKAPPKKRLTFADDNGFYLELKRRVELHMTNDGRRERDCPQMYVKTAVILTAFVTSYVLLVFVSSTWWQALPLAVLLALSIAAIGFNIMHDASHHAYSNKGWVNRVAASSLDVIGGSSYFWHWKHVVFHHNYANIYRYDTDIDLGTLGRLAPQSRRLPIHAFQHWYFWILYGVLVIKWNLYDDFRVALQGRIGEHRYRPMRGGQLAIFIFGKVAFFTIAFGIPLWFHSAGVVALFYILIAIIAGMVMSVVFQLAHSVEEASFPQPQTPGKMDKPWAAHQVETTVNFARNSTLAYWLFGGLNFQIEHHLFPRICHINYPFIAPVVEETCRDFGIRYNVHDSFGQGVVSHFRWLRRMGAINDADLKSR